MYTIHVDKDSESYDYYKVAVNNIIVGRGTKEQCDNLAKELSKSEEKTELIYQMFLGMSK